jgi:hypothetical protein
MRRVAGHRAFTWIEHAGAALAIALFVALLWRPAALRASIDGDKEGRVSELAALLGVRDTREAEIERILPVVSRFPPNEDATRSLADALSKCDMSGLAESNRAQLARRLYAITAGDDLQGDQLAVMLDQIQDAGIEARCSPIAIQAIVDSARRVARTDPKPRKDWW